MTFEVGLRQLKAGVQFEREDARDMLGIMIDDRSLSDESIAEILTLLTKRQVGVDELCGFVDAMRDRMKHITAPEGSVDTCGTGGDKSGTFNISTAAAILLAADGVSVAKHGNRAATSRCGSADVLESLGIATDLAPDAALAQLTEHGFVFLFAPLYHPSLKRLAIVRKQLGFPTVFNLLGPLLSPAAVRHQVVGTFSRQNAELLAQAMAKMGYEHALVLTSEDGLDEASLNAAVHVYDIRESVVTEITINAHDHGLQPAAKDSLTGGDAARNAEMVTAVFEPADILTPQQQIVALNAGLGFYVSDTSASITAGIERAIACLKSGAGKQKLRELQRAHNV